MSMLPFLQGIIVTAEKNIKIYYKKAPVVIFGLLFPLFMFTSFYMGRNIDITIFFPGFLAMALFFTSSSVGPLITPWEKQAGTYERLLSFPVSIHTIILGDVMAGAIYGIIITSLVMIAAGFLLSFSIINVLIIAIALILGTLCFASLGVALASPSVRSPSHIMMFSSLIRFPLIFISGIFIPLQDLPEMGRILSYFSPLTYLVDLFHAGFDGTSVFPVIVDIFALIIFTSVFLLIASYFH
ncbi:MAG: ABC transporter permease, partial [Candidatus Thermoplasmatota archaeon]